MITIGIFPLTGALFVGAKKVGFDNRHQHDSYQLTEIQDVLSVWFSPCIGPRVLVEDREHNSKAEKPAGSY
jgi:hypothetical protein